MVKFQSNFLQKIRENANITDIVGSYVSLKKKGKRYWGCCPFHNEKTPSFSVSPEDGLYYCFGCHEGGDTFSFLQKMETSLWVSLGISLVYVILIVVITLPLTKRR